MITSARRLVLATVLTLLASLLLPVPARAADTGTISGVVTARPDDGTAVPYAGASVRIDRLHETGGNDDALGSAQSDASGHFTVDGVPDGRYQIRIYPDGYVHGDAALGDYGYEYYDDRNGPYGATVVDVTNGAAVTLEHTIELRPIGRVTGRVVDEHGQPMRGSVLVAPEMAGGEAVHTDTNGRYDTLTGEWTRNLIPGEYEASFSADGWGLDDPQYYYVVKPAVVTAGGTTTVDFTVKQRPTVVFTVLDTDGKPLANAPLSFKVRSGGGAWDWPQYGPNETDAQGRYRFVDNADEFKIQFGLPAGYQGTGVPEYWQDAYSFDDAKVLSFTDGVELDRRFTVQLGPAPVSPGETPTITPGTPSISGTPRAGRVLTAQPGTWAPSGVGVGYQWLADGGDIAGATGPTFAVTNAVAGKRLSVRVTGVLAGAASTVATSATTAPVTGVLKTVRPRIAGVARLGKKLRASVRAWSPTAVRLSFQWLRDGKAVKGRTTRTYRLAKADRGHRISLRVTGRKASYAKATSTSPATAKVRR